MKDPGIVISLCDYTGNFAKPWAHVGYECYCVDLRHPVRHTRKEGNIHFVYGDCRSWLPPTTEKLHSLPPSRPTLPAAGQGIS